MQINPYLGFKGTCEQAFKFYERVLGGKLLAMFTYGETPRSDQIAAEWRGKIAHARLAVGDKILMGGDAPPGHGEEAKGFCVNIGVDDPKEADRIFSALAEGGKVQMPIQE